MRSDWFRARLAPVITAALLGWALVPGSARAEDKPPVIRIANPGVGIGARPVTAYGPWSLLHIRGILEEEFKPDGIPVTWTFARGAGPAVNELFANGLADITLLGDLPSILGKSGGLKTRLLATATLSNRYIAVPADTNIHSIKDLANRKVALTKGTCNHLSANRILDANGLQEKDVRMINMDSPTMLSALVTKDIDAAVGARAPVAARSRHGAHHLQHQG